MAKTTLFKGVVYLSDEQYNKLVTDGVIEVGGQTITYDESMVYITPKALPTDYYTKSEIDEKFSQTISKPIITPTATEIVAVDNTNSQTMLAIGDGLSVENGTLKASGGSKLYNHNISFLYKSSVWANLNIITNTQTSFTASSLSQYLYALGYTRGNNKYLAGNNSFAVVDGKTLYQVCGFMGHTNNALYTWENNYSFNITDNTISISQGGNANALSSFIDTVTEL